MFCSFIISVVCFFFFQAEDGIRDDLVTGVQTCALPIYPEKMIDVISRAASNAREVRSKFPTALLFAAIQILAFDADVFNETFCMLGWALQYEVLSIKDRNGKRATLDFKRVGEIYELDGGYIELDRNNPVVQELIKRCTGYWLETRMSPEEKLIENLRPERKYSLCTVLKMLLREGELSLDM